METTLHRQLKQHYGGSGGLQEVTIDGYRIDAVQDGWLIEIQTGTLAGIRNKVRRLLDNYSVLVVKPLVVRKYLIRWNRPGGRVVSSRYSPSRGHLYDVFEDLVHMVEVFPHPNLALEIVLTEQEEHRVPAPRRRKGYRVQDRLLREITDRVRLETAADLVALLPRPLCQLASQEPVTTLEIAREMAIPRWLAQKVGYCLRRTGAARVVGKKGNALLYRIELAGPDDRTTSAASRAA
ncbi:MAG: hypothetical protein GXP27_01345 [Planctomycetes bacterium]|nr:hypothetical protein [Planctomycetota bacterium]